jgi:signal peptidase I
MGVLKKIVKIITNTIIVILFVILAIIIFVKAKTLISGNNYFELFGYSVFEIATGSMEPAISKNDIIVTKKSDIYEINDIITFAKEKDYITHRIISKNNGTYITKGDANNTADDPIEDDVIIGKIIKIYPNLGIWKEVFNNPKILVIIFVTLVIFDIAFSYEPKKNQELSVKRLSKEKEEITKTEIKEIKDNIDNLDEDYTIRLDLTEIQKNINKKINKEDKTKND